MALFQHILVPVDFGDAMRPGLDLAVALARSFDARITLVHAFDASPFTSMDPLSGQIDIEPLLTSAETELKGALVKLRAEWPKSEAVLRRAAACDAVLEVAKERHCDLIVVGTHGRHGVARLLLGSVAEKIVRLSPVPVLTVHPRPFAVGAASAA
jgi:nucleotide-binding universal stress UspA family protein